MQTDEVLRAANRAYRLDCARHGGGYQVPNWANSGIKGSCAILRNCNGVLACYKITKRHGRFHLHLVN
jgi:hypothetical protein